MCRGGTLKFICKRSVGQSIESDKSLERNDILTALSARLNKLKQLRTGDESCGGQVM